MLRVGVLLDTTQPSAWISNLLEHLRVCEFARLEVALFLSSGEDSSFKRTIDSMLFRAYERWDHRRGQCEDNPLATAGISAALNGVKRISLNSHAATIAELNIDVLLLLAQQKPNATLLGCARYGLWSCEIERDSRYLPGPSGFWPMFRQAWTTDCSIVIRTANARSSAKAYSSSTSTCLWSLFGNRRYLYWKAGEIVLRCLREVSCRGEEFLNSLPVSESVGSTDSANSFPGNLQMLAFGGRLFGHWLHARVAGFAPGSAHKWSIMLRQRSQKRRYDDPAGYTIMPCPTDRFYADPFLFERDGRTFLFFEDFRYADGYARISCCEIEPNGFATDPIEVLKLPFHLSYPFVFEDHGNVFMVPESRSSRKVVLYRATDFPSTWTPEATLLENTYAVDSTIFKANGKYWMFSGISDGRYSNSDELSLFFSDSLQGPWKPHPKNPVISDVRCARPAGAVFQHDNKLIRPSQDCSKTYGYGLVFSEIITLTEVDYEERQIAHLYPESTPGSSANHTYNRSRNFEVIDRFVSRKTIPTESFAQRSHPRTSNFRNLSEIDA